MMIKPASSSCNMRCKYCFYSDVSSCRDTANYGIMTRDTMHKLIRRTFFYADDSVSFAFQGGEPTLAGLDFFQDFVRTAEQYNNRNLPVSYALQTNGLKLDDAFCAFFAQHHFLIGVSLDGTPEMHDALRKDPEGNGTYERVIQGIQCLKRHHVEYNILSVITSLSAAQPKQFWKSLAQHRFLQFIPCIDDFSGGLKNYSLTEEAYGRFLIETFSLYEKTVYDGEPVSERRFDNYLALMFGIPSELCGMNGVCGNYFLVEADGSVYPCDFYALDPWRMGNIHTDPLRKMEESSAAREFRAISHVLPEDCKSCKWLSLCRGGCRRDREPYENGLPGKNRFCGSYRAFFEACYPRMKAIVQYLS